MENVNQYLQEKKYISYTVITNIRETLLNDNSISESEIEKIVDMLLSHNLKYIEEELIYLIQNDKFISIDLLNKIREYLIFQSDIDSVGICNIFKILIENEKVLFKKIKIENDAFLDALKIRENNDSKSTSFVQTEQLKQVITDSHDKEDLSLKLDISFYIALLEDAKTYEEICEILPNLVDDTCNDIINMLLVHYCKELFELEQFLKNEFDNELNEYKNQIFEKINCIKKYRDSFKNSKNKIVKPENIVIFLTTDCGNVCVENDIERDIDPAHYPDVIQLIESIKNGTFKNVKQFSNNTLLNGLSEVRAHPHQSRVTFKRLEGNIYVVLQAFVKKSDNPSFIISSASARYDIYKSKLLELKEKVKNPEFIKENKEIYTRIKKTLLGQKGEEFNGRVNKKHK